jgi:antitoxin (DNA-binding transcriptional repressor) of toxin-antitoxin stability system
MLHRNMARPLTVRDLRLHWPLAERRLRTEREIVVTRDGRPVAKLSAYGPTEAPREHWAPERHLEWLRRTWKKPAGPTTDELLARDRGK